ncbi:HNH endonuclease [Nocardia sp. NPDC050697]|uniref:HNH endonuclease n=1 Tax=Nocardia sp. NPDC050697 TaxID=3155158 RepID=UPI0033FE359E
MPERTCSCAHCGAAFITSHPRKIYCKRKCAAGAMNERHNKRADHTPRPCLICGAEFTPARSDSRTCSVQCRNKRRYEHEPVRYEKTCVECGRTFQAKRSDAVRCSRQCTSMNWYERNRETQIARATEWNRTNPARRTIVSNHRGRRRASEAAGPGITHCRWVRLQRRQRDRCAYCAGPGPLTLDHIVPLSRGGAHAEGNMAGACGTCNYSKGASLLVEWRKRQNRRATSF